MKVCKRNILSSIFLSQGFHLPSKYLCLQPCSHLSCKFSQVHFQADGEDKGCCLPVEVMHGKTGVAGDFIQTLT